MQDTPRIINMEETIGKTVGRRKLGNPLDPNRHTKKMAKDWCDAFPPLMPPKGVFRFHTHEEADEWLTKNIRMRKAAN